MDDEVLLQRLRAALARLWEESCPVANPRNPYHGRTPEVALRRWRSFGRRAGVQSATRDQRIEDLAKGLRDAFERDRHLVGRLMEDYRHLARTFADVLEEH